MKTWPLSLALAVAATGPAVAGVVVSIAGRITAPVSPVVGTLKTNDAFTAARTFGTLSPTLLAAPRSLTPALAAPAAAPMTAGPESASPEKKTGELGRVTEVSPAMAELVEAARDRRPEAFLEETSDTALLGEAWRREDPRGGPSTQSGYKKGDIFTVPKKNIKFNDADTVAVLHNGKKAIIRFGGVDAPEIAHPGLPGQPQTAQPYGAEAAEFLKQLILRGNSLTITVEDMDQYGRVVGALALNLPDGTTLNVQQELVRAGWSWQYVFYNSDTTLKQLQREARAARRGLWQGLDVGGAAWPEPPWVFRRREKAGIARILPGDAFQLMVDHMPDADTLRNVKGQLVYGSIRLAGVDAPEVAHSQSQEQPFGVEASARARELLIGKTVTVTAQDTDRYGRLVAWIRFRDKTIVRDLHKVLLQEGWAWWYQQYYPELTELGELEKAAREARLGLWKGLGRADHMPPWQWREEQRRKPDKKP